MRFSEFLNNLSLKTILAINIFLAILVFIPLTVFLTKQQTKITGRAYLPAPTKTIPLPTPILPQITPSEPPEITFISPFYGKAGDSVIIKGKNFGSKIDDIYFNDVKASKIKSWKNNQIHVLVPENATSGKIKIKEAISPYNFIVFEKKTFCELLFEATPLEKIIQTKNCPVFSKIKLILKGTENDFDYKVKPGPLSPIELKMEKSLTNEEVFLKIEASDPKNIIFEKMLIIEAPISKKLTLISAELLQGENLMPFFVNPLNLTE